MAGDGATPSLHKCADGYYRTWWSAQGRRRVKSFGRDRTLARRRFQSWLADWLDAPRLCGVEQDEVTIGAAWAQCAAWARRYYRRPDGTLSGQHAQLSYAMAPVVELFGAIPAREFGVRHLRAVRQRLLERGSLSRRTINARINQIRRVWRWFAEHELAGGHQVQELAALRPIPPGRLGARESAPVQPVSEAVFQAIIETARAARGWSLRAAGSLAELQWWSAMRPAEACSLRGTDIEHRRTCWLVRPAMHKTAHRGRRREIWLGPRAQRVLTALPTWGSPGPLFAGLLRGRPLAGRRGDGSAALVRRYRQLLHELCRRCGVEPVSPNRFRHAAATRLRARYGLEVAQVVLGHASAAMTEVYAGPDGGRAAQVLAEAG